MEYKEVKNNNKFSKKPLIGDLVEYINITEFAKHYTVKVGARAIVMSIEKLYINVRWIDEFGIGLRDTQSNGNYSCSFFKLIDRDCSA